MNRTPPGPLPTSGEHRTDGGDSENKVHPLADFYRLPAALLDAPALAAGRDLARVLDWYRRELYLKPEAGLRRLLSHRAVRRGYYAIRPFVPAAVRLQAQRYYLGDWTERTFPRWPVDTTVENLLGEHLAKAIQDSGRSSIPFIWFWPRGAAAAAMITHDVETAVGLEFLDTLLDIDHRYGVPASIQLVPEGRYSTSRRLVDRLQAAGWEVNLHGLDHEENLFGDPAAFAKRRAAINHHLAELQIDGFRSPCMYRDAALIDQLDIRFDMSVPNVAHLEPQRGGCCSVFPYSLGRVLELPLTAVQDYGLFRILRQRSIDLWKQQIQTILARNGLMSFIVHPDYVRAKPERELYRELLRHLTGLASDVGIWIARAGDIARWWRQREHLHLIEREGRWSIAGEGSERARLAFARLEEGRPVFEFGGCA